MRTFGDVAKNYLSGWDLILPIHLFVRFVPFSDLSVRMPAISSPSTSGPKAAGSCWRSLDQPASQTPRLALREIHRFENRPVAMAGLRWNIQQLWAEITAGMAKAAAAADGPIDAISTDSWGVDYVLLGRGSSDACSAVQLSRSASEQPFPATVPRSRPASSSSTTPAFSFCRSTRSISLPPSPRAPARAAERDAADRGLLQSSAGRTCPAAGRCEISMASTTQLVRRAKAAMVLAADRSRRPAAENFPESGRRRRQSWAPAGLLDGAQVVAGLSHDTGCAVAAVPADDGDDWAYLSSGTWSLVGFEIATTHRHPPLS